MRHPCEDGTNTTPTVVEYMYIYLRESVGFQCIYMYMYMYLHMCTYIASRVSVSTHTMWYPNG